LDLLGLLVERQGQLVLKDAIMQAVWPGTVVEGNLTVQISALRRILDENRKEGSCIQTVPGRGYRFAAPVTGSNARNDKNPPPPPATEAIVQSSTIRNCEIQFCSDRSGACPDRYGEHSTGIGAASWLPSSALYVSSTSLPRVCVGIRLGPEKHAR
jgi:hypothetical protein